MIKITNVETFGWKPAIRGMRNPMNSWDKSDSISFDFYDSNETGDVDDYVHDSTQINQFEYLYLGPNDFDLMQRLSKAGTDHRKFMRMITVYCDILAPLYWWKEFDTYKVGTVTNSCSTMHKIHAKDFYISDFSEDHLLMERPDESIYDENERDITMAPNELLGYICATLNTYRNLYLETKNKKYWWQMIQLLPSSYNQKRTVMMNYEVLANIYKSRKTHKLDEWHTFCYWIESLPYSGIITGCGF